MKRWNAAGMLEIEQVKYMVIDGTSSRRTRNYLHRWIAWWVETSETWQYQELLQWFIEICWHKETADYAAALNQLHLKTLRTTETDLGSASIVLQV